MVEDKIVALIEHAKEQLVPLLVVVDPQYILVFRKSDFQAKLAQKLR